MSECDTLSVGGDLTLLEDQVTAQWKGHILGGTLVHVSGFPLSTWQEYTLDTLTQFFSKIWW